MATNVIMPALEMAQDMGKLVRWLKREGEPVTKGEPIMEIETDKVTVEIEASSAGVLGGVSAYEGDRVPVGQTIAWILSPGESVPASSTTQRAKHEAASQSLQLIRNPFEASLGEIAAQRADLAARANTGKLRPADMAGGTFTITHLGMYHVDAFNAIVNPPQAAILAVGRIADRVVPINGQPAVRPMMTLTLSCDHRVVDGARAAKFLDDLATLIEEPWGLLA